MKSVKSKNSCTSVIQITYDILKANGGELKAETLSAEGAVQAGKEGRGAKFIIDLPVNN